MSVVAYVSNVAHGPPVYIKFEPCWLFKIALNDDVAVLEIIRIP